MPYLDAHNGDMYMLLLVASVAAVGQPGPSCGVMSTLSPHMHLPFNVHMLENCSGSVASAFLDSWCQSPKL